MAETNSPYIYSGFSDHVYNTDDKEIVTLSVSKCNFEPETPLEERQPVISLVREQDPDKIPVMILIKNCGTLCMKGKLFFFVESKLNIGDLFTMSVKKICNLDGISNMTHQGPNAEKLLSKIYEEHKDEDGCLYMTLSGAFPKLVVEGHRTQFNQRIVRLVQLLKDFHSLQENVPKRPRTGRLGSILSFLWRFSPWK